MKYKAILLTLLVLKVYGLSGQTLQQVTDNGASTTSSIWAKSKLTLHLIEKDEQINAERESNGKRDQEFVRLREELIDFKKLLEKVLNK